MAGNAKYLGIMTAKFSALFAFAALSFGAVSCSTPAGNRISKVSTYKLDTSDRVDAADPSIRFEQRYRMHGAVSKEELEAREGRYFTAHWSVDGGGAATLKMEYRLAKTGAKVYTKSEEVSGSGTTEFAIVGSEVKDHGNVTSWRIILVRGKEELAEYKSYLWQ
jgi:hypothetical protein